MTWFQSVIDDFSASSVNTGIWTEPNGATGVAISGGKLRLSSVASYPTVISPTTFNLTSGLLAVQFSSSGTAAVETEFYFGVNDNAGANISLGWDPESGFFFTSVSSGLSVTASTMPSSALVSGQWIACGNYNASTKTLLFYSSSDGQTWTQIGSITVSGTFNSSACGVFISVGYYGSSSSNYIGLFDNVSTWTQTAPVGGGGSGGGSGGGGSSGAGTTTYLGVYETNGTFPEPGPGAWPSGPTTNMTATYMSWGQDWATYAGAIINKCIANSIRAFVELEPMNAGDNWDETPLFSDIISGLWDTWLLGIGTFIASTGIDCWLTFAHEFNVSGQYPWAQGMTGSGPGGGELSPAQWIQGWKYVHDKINQTANGHAKWVWACSAFTGGTTISPAPYWPGASYVDIVGIDGYPSTEYGEELGTFAGQLQPTVTIIRNLGWSEPIGLSETNLHQMANGGTDTSVSPPVSFGPGQDITSFVADMAAAGVNWILEFEDAGWGLSPMTSEEWDEYNAAIAANFTSSGGSGGGTATYTQTVVDAFDGSSLDGSIWTNDGDTNDHVTVSGGTLQIGAHFDDVQEVDSVEFFDFTTGIVGMKYSHTGTAAADTVGDGSTGTQVYWGIVDSSSNYLELQTWPASNVWQPWSDGEGATVASPIGDQNAFGSAWTNDNWLGIGNYNIDNDHRIHVYSSTDLTTWTEIASWEITGALDMTNAGIIMGTNQLTNAATTWVSIFDDVSFFLRSGSDSGGSGGSSSSPVQVRVGGAWVESIPKCRVGGAWVTAVAKVRIAGAWVALSSSSGDGGDGGDGGGGTPTYTQTVIDAFSGSSINSSLWSNWGSPSDISVAGGLLKAKATGSYTFVSSSGGTAHDLTSGIFAAQFTNSQTPTNTAAFAFFAVTDDTGTGNNAWAIQAYIGNNSWNGYNANGTVVDITGDQTAFSSEWTNGDWLGWGMIGEDSIMHVYKSSDSVTWTEIATVAMTGGLDKTTAYIGLGAACDSGTSPYLAEFAEASYFAVSS